MVVAFVAAGTLTATFEPLVAKLGMAKVYLSLFPGKENEDSLQHIREKAAQVRAEMGLRLKNQLRHIPEFVFYLDDSLDYIDNIDNLLKE